MAGGTPADGAQERAAHDVRVRWPWAALAALAGLAAALALVALAAAAAGPPAITGESALARWLAASPAEPSPQAPTTPTPGGDDAQAQQQAGPTRLAWIGLALAAVVVALAARALLRREHADGGTWVARLPAPGAAGAPARGLADQVRRAAERASERADRLGAASSTDEVITCWVALEAAATRAGTARDPAQTPTEFTTAVLAAQHADADAVRRLLHLYHQARFGGRPLPPAAGGEAASALARIAASLGASGAAGTTGTTGRRT